MLDKSIRQVMNFKFLNVLLIVSVSVFAGCKTNLLSGQDAPVQVQSQPLAPPAPVVVEGLRVSYADVVEKLRPPW
jgi:hypothetical protein